jgi:hypothetical protein
MDSPRFSPALLAFLVGAPLVWGVLLMFHPRGDGTDIYGDISDNATAWMAVHLGMLVFIPLLALAVYLLLRGLEGTAAKVSRIALVPFVVFYSAWETLQGIGNGALVDQVNALAEPERAAGAALVQDFAESPLVKDLGILAVPGTLGLIVALIAAGVALHREAGAPLAVPVLLGISGFLIAAHPPPLGPTGLGLFIVAVLLLARGRAAAPAAAPLAQPGPA